jgi:hypothetical protein
VDRTEQVHWPVPRALLSRRELVRVGALGLGGLTLPGLLRLERLASAEPVKARKATARSVIVLFLSGGPAHQDMWDLKPEAPEEIRGTFQPVATNVSGIAIGEHMPRMARLADRYAIVRSMRHQQANHPAAAYWMMVGSPIQRPTADASFMSRSDRPHVGSVVSHFLGPGPGVPAFVLLPEAMAPNGPERAGQFAGFLGAVCDPYRINSDPNRPDFTPGVLSLEAGLGPQRLEARKALRSAVAQQGQAVAHAAGNEGLDAYYTQAFDLISSPAAQRAFDLSAEPKETRDRYGRHIFGQSVLLARRMVQAGVRLVQVNWVRHDNGPGGQGYDTHRNHLAWAKDELLPPTDAAFSSLVEDLHRLGLLEETLVVMMGEFGRTPRFNKAGGRDHWPFCFSVVMAGGGIRGGQVFGASDKIGAYPARDPVSPADLAATLYHCLGLDPQAEIRDLQNRPYPLAPGMPIEALL